jgi:hypothetical protein
MKRFLFAALIALLAIPSFGEGFDFRSTGTETTTVLRLRPSNPLPSPLVGFVYLTYDPIGGCLKASVNGAGWACVGTGGGGSTHSAGDYTAAMITAAPFGTVTGVNVQTQLTQINAKIDNRVQDVFGRFGHVVAQSGDYTAGQVVFVPAGSIAATTVQAALQEVASEAIQTAADNTITGTMTFTGYAGATAPVTIQPSAAPAANTTLLKVNNNTGTTLAKIDSEGDATVHDLTVTGTPTAPTAVSGTNTTQLATTAFVRNSFNTTQTIGGNFTFNAEPTIASDGGNMTGTYNSNFGVFKFNFGYGLRFGFDTAAAYGIISSAGASSGLKFFTVNGTTYTEAARIDGSGLFSAFGADFLHQSSQPTGGSGTRIINDNTSSTGQAIFLNRAGDGTTSSRTVFNRYTSTETTSQVWDWGMIGSKTFALRNLTLGTTSNALTVNEASNLVSFPAGLLGVGSTAVPTSNVPIDVATSNAGNTNARFWNTSTVGGSFVLAQAGDGTTSARIANFRMISNETVQQEWRAGMNGTKSYVIRDNTAGADRITVDQATGNATLSGTLKERGRSVAMGEWTTFTPSIAATGGGTAVVSGYNSAKYMLIGKTLFVQVSMATGALTITGTVTKISMTIPGGFTCASQATGLIPFNNNGTSGIGSVSTTAAATTIDLFQSAFFSGTWAVSSANSAFELNIPIEVQ